MTSYGAGRHAAATRRSPWRPLAVAALGLAVLAIGGQGVWGSLNATATNTSPQSVTSGSLKLTMAATGVGVEQTIGNIAPNDVVNRHLVLTNGGTLTVSDIAFSVTAPASSPLVTDAGTSKALKVTVKSCPTPWVATSGTCAGGLSTVAMAQRVLSAVDTPVNLTLPAAATAVDGKAYLQVSVTLPDQDEVTTNGTAPAGSIQARTVALTYVFTATQRTGTTTNS